MANKYRDLSHYELLQLLKNEIFKDLHVCVPGTVAGVNDDGTVSVDVALKLKVGVPGLPMGLDTSWPQIGSVPVVTPQGSGGGFVAPPQVGDGCLVVFSDRCIDGWFTTGQPQPLTVTRMHDISDGFAIVGINSQAAPLDTPLAAGEVGLCETQDPNGAKVAINPSTGLITVASGAQNLATTLGNLVTAINNLITVLNSLTVSGVTSGGSTAPVSAATIAALVPVTTSLTAVQTQLSALLY